MKVTYNKEVKKGKTAKVKIGKDQTNLIFFNSETLQGLLAKADNNPKKGGGQFYIIEYAQEVAAKHHPNEVEKLNGDLMLVMRLANIENELIAVTIEGDLANKGRLCPPLCYPSSINS